VRDDIGRDVFVDDTVGGGTGNEDILDGNYGDGGEGGCYDWTGSGSTGCFALANGGLITHHNIGGAIGCASLRNLGGLPIRR
jgi:hypothetical protein